VAKKKKLTKAQRADIARRNLKKAWAAKRKAVSVTGKRVKARTVKTPKGRNAVRVTGKRLAVRKVKANPLKKRRTPAQMAATRKMIAAAKAARRGSVKTPRKAARKATMPKPRKAKAGHHKSAKRVAAGKKAAATRKRNARKAMPKSKPRKAKAKATHHKDPRRVAAGKKGAATRAAKKAAHQGISRGISRAADEGYAYERPKKRGKGKGKRKKNPFLPNPIPMKSGLDFFGSFFAIVFGGSVASLADRFAVTHALTAATGASSYMDAPAAGQIYNSEAMLGPIWGSWQRLLAAGASIFVPLGISAVVKSAGPRGFLQLMSLAAIGRTVVKAADDGLSMALKANSIGMRVFAPEQAAQNKLAAAKTAALPQAAPSTFAGAPADANAASANSAAGMMPPPPPPPPKIAPPPALPSPTRDIQFDRRTSAPVFNPWAVPNE
jgi:hypothetical protein